jgi:hypothetical protein
MIFMASTLFLVSFYEVKARSLLAVSAFLAFVWIDDSMQYHERMGALIAVELNLTPVYGLRPVDLGELIAWALVGVALTPVVVWAYLGRRPGDQTLLRLVSVPFIALILCGVVIDMIHVVVPKGSAGLMLTVLEDGGEMLAIATLVVVSFGMSRNSKIIYA